MRAIDHWINGKTLSGTSGRQLPVYDPATGEQQAYVVAATQAETDLAVATALAAYPGWRAQSLSRRAEVMFRFRDLVDANRKEIASLVSSEHGKMVPMWMFCNALACGNTFVLKPSEKDPSVSLLLADLLRQAGLPDGAFGVVQGDRSAVEALIEHPDVQALSFVGSTPVARSIYEAGTRRGKRVQALGGAKNHTRGKVITSRWPDPATSEVDLGFPKVR
jgi:acyl-CoA reductase-like NAD-dependent aldehyde dehydrogenase